MSSKLKLIRLQKIKESLNLSQDLHIQNNFIKPNLIKKKYFEICSNKKLLKVNKTKKISKFEKIKNKESLKTKEPKNIRKRIKMKKIDGAILTNRKLNKNVSTNELPINFSESLKQSHLSNQINESKCNCIDGELDRIYCPRSPKKIVGIKAKAKDKVNCSPTRSSTIENVKNVKKSDILVKEKLTLVGEENVHMSEIFIPRSINSAPNLKSNALLKTNKNDLPEVVVPKKKIWRKGKEALIELLHSNENLMLESCKNDSNFEDTHISANDEDFGLNVLHYSNALVSPNISNIEHYKILEERERDFQKLQNLNQDALTVLRSQNRNTMKKGKRKKVDKSMEERGSKMPKVVAKEESDHLNGICNGSMEFNISNSNLCQLPMLNYQQVQIENISSIPNVNYNELTQNNTVFIVQNDEMQLVQNIDSNQWIQQVNENQLTQNVNLHEKPQSVDSNQRIQTINPNQLIQDIDPKELVENDEVCIIQNICNNHHGENDEVHKYENINQNIQYNNIDKQFHDPKKDMNIRDSYNNHTSTKINNIEKNDIANEHHVFQGVSDLNIIEKNIKSKNVRNVNTHVSSIHEKRDSYRNGRRSSHLDGSFQSDYQYGKKSKVEKSPKIFKDVQRIYHLPNQIKHKNSIKELKSHNQQKSYIGIESNKIKMQTKIFYVHGSTNQRRGFYDNSSLNLEITKQKDDENKKHVRRKKDDDGLNTLLDEVRKKFCCIKNWRSGKKVPQFIETPKQYTMQVDTTHINSEEVYKSNGSFSCKTSEETLIQDNDDQRFKSTWLKKNEKKQKRTTCASCKKSINSLICAKQKPSDLEMHAKKIMESYLEEVNIETKYGFNALNETKKEDKSFIKTKHKHDYDMEKKSNRNLRTMPSFDKHLEEYGDLEDITDFFLKKDSARQIPQVECHMAPNGEKNQYVEVDLNTIDEDEETKNFCYEDFISNYLQKGVLEGLLEPSSYTTQINVENKEMNLESKRDLHSTTSNSTSIREVQKFKSNCLQDSCSKTILNVENKEYLPISNTSIPIFCNNREKTKKIINDEVVPSLHYIQKTSQITVEILDDIVKKFHDDHVKKTHQREENEKFLQNNIQIEKCGNYQNLNENAKECDVTHVKVQELLWDKSYNDKYYGNNTTPTTPMTTKFCGTNNYSINDKEINKAHDLEHKFISHNSKHIALVPIDESFGEILERLTSNDILQYESGRKNVQRSTQTYPIMQLGDVVDSQTNTSPNSKRENTEQIQIIVQCTTKMDSKVQFLEVETDTHDLPTFSKILSPSFCIDWNDNASNTMKHQNNENNTNFSLNLDEGHNHNSYWRNSMDVGKKKDLHTKNTNFIENLSGNVQCHLKKNHSLETNDKVFCKHFYIDEDPIEDVHIFDQNNLMQDFDNTMDIGKTARDYYQSNAASKCEVIACKGDNSSQSAFLCTNEDDINSNEINSPLILLGYDKIDEDLFANENTFKCEYVENGSYAYNSNKLFVNFAYKNENTFEDIVSHNDENIVENSCEIISQEKINQSDVGDYKTTTSNHEYFQICSLSLDNSNITDGEKINECDILQKIGKTTMRNKNTKDYYFLKIFLKIIDKEELDSLDMTLKVKMVVCLFVIDENEIDKKSKNNIMIVGRNTIAHIYTNISTNQCTK